MGGGVEVPTDLAGPSNPCQDEDMHDTASRDDIPQSMSTAVDSVSELCCSDGVLDNVDLINAVLKSLDIVDVCRVARTSKSWHEACNHSAHWTRLAFIQRRMTLPQVRDLGPQTFPCRYIGLERRFSALRPPCMGAAQ